MTEAENGALIEETRRLIEEVESGRAEHVAWVAIQDRIRRLYEGRTQREVAELIGKAQTWVQVVLRWDYERNQTPFAKGARPEESDASDRSAAKRALRGPEKRAKVIESLDEDERLALATEALAPERRDEERKAKERRATRESRPDRDRTHVEMIVNSLGSADLYVLRAIDDARGTTWSEEGASMIEARIGVTEARLDLLRQGVQPSGPEIDWDEALAKLETEA